ncbi:MAG: DNA polymerase III subunit gamma/tau [Terriglobales bacterium]
MAYTVLARKYRPQRFSDVIGQEHVTRTLKNALEQGRIAHGYIFSGHRGIGKTTVARILAMALNCRSADRPLPEPCGVCDSCVEIRESRAVDVIEIDAATNRGIDEIRELREAARYRPARDRYKIYILDEAHQITDAAFNALLKTLEEPPSHIVFMMATTQPEDIPQTIRSRCQHFSFHAVKFDDIVSQLRTVAEQEQIQADEDALAMLAEAGDGSMRDALSIMDQAIACCGTQLTGETVRQLVGTVPSETLEHMMAAVQRNSSEDVLRLVDKLVTEGQSPTHFARQMVRFMRNALVAKVAGNDSQVLQISSDERARVGRVAAMFSEEDLARFLQILLRTHSELGYKQEQRFHLELGLLKLVHAQRLLPVEELLSAQAATGTTRGNAGPARVSEIQRTPTQAVSKSAQPSPFSSDVARKTTPRSEADSVPQARMTAAAAAPARQRSVEPSSAVAPPIVAQASSESDLQEAVTAAAEQAGYVDLANMLRGGQWTVTGGQINVQVPDSSTLVKLTLNEEGERLLNAAAARVLGRPARFKITGMENGSARPPAPRPVANGTRTRVADEPVIQRLKEKFNAEIRSVIDYREKH